MDIKAPLVISISRQLGCGGSYLGQKLADQFQLLYLDKEILKQVSDKFGISSGNLEWREERIVSNWLTIINLISSLNPQISLPYLDYTIPSVPIYLSNEDLFKAESEIILKVASEKPSVFIGRGSSSILKDHPKHVSIFLHAEKPFRLENVQRSYGVTSNEARRIIDLTDKSRARFVREQTGADMNDATQYDLCLDTGVIGLEKSFEVIKSYIIERFNPVQQK